MDLSQINYTDLIGELPYSDFEYEDATNLHMGSCQIFAKALHDTFPSYELESSFHMFCRVDGLYIDASGVAETAQELVDRLPVHGTVNEIKTIDDVVLEDENEEKGYQFALIIIEDNPDVYDISKIKREKELCVRCGKESRYMVSSPVEYRLFFVEGVGQFCPECWKKLRLSNNQASESGTSS